MTLIFYNKILFTILLYALKIQCQTINKLSPGCSLVQTKIYCFGGNSQENNNKVLPSSTHISLDLAKFNNFTTFDKNAVEWTDLSSLMSGTNVTIQPRVFTASAPVYSTNSYVIYGGVGAVTGPSAPPISSPFSNYQPSSNDWRSLNLPSGGNYTSRASIVNLGNDTMWIWGGEAQSSSNFSSNVIYLYDYRASQWLNQINSDWSMRVEHTATLASNNMIYVLGGSNKINNTLLTYSDFNQIIGFNTQTLSWSNITVGGDVPKGRVSHTTTQVPGKNLLFIYGGVNAFKDPADLLDDSLCYTYDYVENSFKQVQIPKNPFNSANTLYGHFATSYADSFMVFAFGFVNYGVPAFSISVLNITNLYSPSWITEPLSVSNNTIPDETHNDNSSSGLSTGTVVAITVPIVVIVVGCTIGILAFLRYKAKKQAKPANDFYLEDPRNTLDEKNHFGFSSTEGERDEDENINDTKDMNRCKPSEIDSVKPAEVGSVKPTEFYEPFNNDGSVVTLTTTAVDSQPSSNHR